MTKVLAFVFWALRGFFRGFLYDDGYSDWKALALISCTEILGIMTGIFITSLAVGHRLLPTSKPILWVLGVGIALGTMGANYYMLRFENRWARFETEFQAYSMGARILSGIAIVVVFVILAVTAIASATAVGHLPVHPTAI
jgi:hypothetical protein